MGGAKFPYLASIGIIEVYLSLIQTIASAYSYPLYSLHLSLNLVVCSAKDVIGIILSFINEVKG